MWPAALLLVLVLAAVAGLAVPGLWMVIFLPSLLFETYPILAVAIAMVTFVTPAVILWRKSPVAGCAMLLVPVILTLLIQVPSPSRSLVHWGADLARVIYFRSDLQRSYEEAKQRGRTPAFAALAVDGFLGMTSGIAYDPSGEIGLPRELRSKPWTDAAADTELGADYLEAQRIVGSYYTWFHP
jgi:hypothetical protein